MQIFDSFRCPRCDEGEVRFIVENNRVTSHGKCNSCDLHLSADRIQFHLDCNSLVDEWMEETRDLDICDECGKFTLVEVGQQMVICQDCAVKSAAKRLEVFEAEAELLLHKTKGGLLC